MNEPTARALYRKFLRLYPRDFRDKFGESMQQAFNDLYRERKTENRLFKFLLWTFAETGLGIFREHMLLLTDGGLVKTLLSNPRSAAIASLMLSLPLGLTYVALIFNVEPLARMLNNLFTTDSQQGGTEINMLGRIVLYGGLLLLPVAFALNLRAMLKKEGVQGERKLQAINIITGIAILLLITLTWGSLIMEEIYCLKGIRCD